jgi:EAL domain-containing protein (putative c-di-GMP-specific phosphodiesterase class I)
VLRRRLIAYGQAPDLRDMIVRDGLAADFDVLALNDYGSFVEHLLPFAPSLALIGMTETPDDTDEALDAVQKEMPKTPVVLMTDRPFTRVRAAMALAEQRKLTMLQPLPYPCPPGELAAHLATIPAPEAPLSAADLAMAIRDRQLVVHFQPKVDLRSGEPVGAEALVRWRHPERGMIPPDRFITLAEQSGLISELTYVVIAATIEMIHGLRAVGWALTMSINVSARSLVEVTFSRRILDMLEAEAVPPHQITFEVTESAAMLRVGLIRQVLADLRGRGFGVSLDDFGTGYSTLEELHRMPFSELKVDKQFVISLLEDPGARAITESTINLAHNLGLEVVAEGVETAEAYDRLKLMGCDLAQGYFISRPLSADDFHAWLGAR